MSCPKCTWDAKNIMLLGKPFSYWCDIEAVLQIHWIDGPLSLTEALRNDRFLKLYLTSTWHTEAVPTPTCDFCHDGELKLQVFRDGGYVMHHIDADFCPKCGRKIQCLKN